MPWPWRRAFAREATFLLLFGLVLAPAIFGWLLTDLTARQDEIANAGRDKQAAGMIDFLADRHLAILLDYAFWDDFYHAATVKHDREWLDLNIGYAGLGRDAALVLDPEMRPVYGSWQDESRIWDAEAVTRGGFRDLFRQVAETPGQAGAAGYLAVGDQLAVVGIARITPYELEDVDPLLEPRYLAFLQILGDDWLASLRGSWPDLTLATAAPAGPARAVRGPDGSVVGHVGWNAPHLGGTAMRSRLPFLIAGLFLTSAATLGLFLRMRQAAGRLVEAEAAARRQAECDPLTGIANRRKLAMEAGRHARLGAGDPRAAGRLRRLQGGERPPRPPPRRRAADRDGRTHGPHAARRGGAGAGRGRRVRRRARRLAPGRRWSSATTWWSRSRRPSPFPGQVVAISASVGVAGAAPGMDADELVRRADVAMYSAKAERAGLTRYYDDALDATRRSERGLDDEMREGLRRGEFWVAYQPIYSAAAGELVAVEALARWNHPLHGAIAPGVFIPVAERSRFILELGDFVLRTACRRVAEAGGDIALSVNLSPVQLLDDRIVEQVAAILTETGLAPHRLELEVTEGISSSRRIAR